MRASRILSLVAVAASTAHGYDFKALKPQGYVSDFARVVDTASQVELERYCRDLEDRTGVQLALVTIKSLEGEPVSDVANLLYRTWGVGQRKSNEGALLLLAVDDRRSRLEVGYGLEPILTDLSTGGILREMRPALRENHYGDALIAAVRAMSDRILAAKGITSGGPAPLRSSRPRQAEPAVPAEVWIFLAIIVVMFFLNNLGGGGGRYRGGGGRGGGIFPIFFPTGMSGGSRHGGGFGGMSDGGGGFGGFGGGDSGGGGASGDW